MEEELIVTIEYETPPTAEEIGALFTALALDYRDFTRGRVLSVINIEHGSIIATLKDWALVALPYVKDAVEVAKGAKALADFGKMLKEGINALKTEKPKRLPSRRGRKTKGERFIQESLKIAAEHGRAIRVKHTSKSGETFDAEMSAPEAMEIRANLAEVTPEIQSAPALRIPSTQLALADPAKAVGRLYEPSAAELSFNEAQAIIDVLVDVLQSAGLSHVLPQIAADLSQKGLFTLASALEARIHHSGRNTEPPLTTT
jgi:hypothetical protein